MQQRCASQSAKERSGYTRIRTLIVILLLCGLPSLAMAQEATAPNSGDTAWMLTATALVLFMTIPGLALFYGGLVRVQNVLSVLMQCFALTGLITIVWVICGYSLAFNTAGMEAGTLTVTSFVGGLGTMFFTRYRCGHPLWDYPRNRFYYVPVDLCHHHTRPYCGSIRGTDEILGNVNLLRGLVDYSIRPPLPHGMVR